MGGGRQARGVEELRHTQVRARSRLRVDAARKRSACPFPTASQKPGSLASRQFASIDDGSRIVVMGDLSGSLGGSSSMRNSAGHRSGAVSHGRRSGTDLALRSGKRWGKSVALVRAAMRDRDPQLGKTTAAWLLCGLQQAWAESLGTVRHFDGATQAKAKASISVARGADPRDVCVIQNPARSRCGPAEGPACRHDDLEHRRRHGDLQASRRHSARLFAFAGPTDEEVERRKPLTEDGT